MKPDTIIIEGRTYSWRALLELRRDSMKRQAYLRSIVAQVEVDKDRIRIYSDKDALAAAASGSAPNVRGFVRNWWTRFELTISPLEGRAAPGPSVSNLGSCCTRRGRQFTQSQSSRGRHSPTRVRTSGDGLRGSVLRPSPAICRWRRPARAHHSETTDDDAASPEVGWRPRRYGFLGSPVASARDLRALACRLARRYGDTT